MIFELLVQIIFGWPFIIAALLLSAAGILLKRHQFLVAGALFFLPPSLYLSGYPGLRWFALLLPFFIFGAAYFVRENRPGLAWLLLLPPIALSAWLAYVVLTQSRNFS
ncbi:MAG TPA: hypothetical protein VFO91_10770 [Anaerolineales bacterium]|nr:hypothetical protein [Anaerolineales bacterium]